MEKIIHLLIPRESNNHKAKILHTSSLFVVVFLFLFLQYSLTLLNNKEGFVLGYASNISIDEVVRLTNQKRNEIGLSSLTLNRTLSDAAYLKGQDMITKDYWAHTAPDGTEPWWFFNRMGYKYKVAGENLARDFNSAGQAVEAWMQSPTHKDNILNPKYKEIGIGVVEGDLAGSDTTIIVQFFGTSYSDFVKPTIATTDNINTNVTNSLNKEFGESPKDVNEGGLDQKTIVVDSNFKSDLVLSKSEDNILVSPFVTTKNTSVVVVSVLLVVFLVDWLIVSRRRIARIAGKTFAHIAYLGMILVVTLILKAGKII